MNIETMNTDMSYNDNAWLAKWNYPFPVTWHKISLFRNYKHDYVNVNFKSKGTGPKAHPTVEFNFKQKDTYIMAEWRSQVNKSPLLLLQAFTHRTLQDENSKNIIIEG